MQNAALVRVVDRFRHSLGQTGGALGRQRQVSGQRCQVPPGDIIHGQVMLVLVNADLVNRHNIGMPQTAGGGGFHAQAFDELVASEGPEAQQFHGDQTANADLPRPVHNAHAATAEFLQQLIIAKPPAFTRPSGTLAPTRRSGMG